jgi:hypothetical protein
MCKHFKCTLSYAIYTRTNACTHKHTHTHGFKPHVGARIAEICKLMAQVLRALTFCSVCPVKVRDRPQRAVGVHPAHVSRHATSEWASLSPSNADS